MVNDPRASKNPLKITLKDVYNCRCQNNSFFPLILSSTHQLQLLPLYSGCPTISWQTGGWGRGPWSQAGCWTRACSSSWPGCWRRWSQSWGCRVCSGRAEGSSPCQAPGGPWPQSSPPSPSVHHRPAGSAAVCCSICVFNRGYNLRSLQKSLYTILYTICHVLNINFIVFICVLFERPTQITA